MHGPTFCLSSDAVFEQVFVLMDQMRFLTDPGRLRGDYKYWLLLQGHMQSTMCLTATEEQK